MLARRSGKVSVEGGGILRLRKEADRMAAACGECDGPCFHATFNLNTSGGWVVGPHFGAFSCTQIHQSGVQRKATTAYSANMVSPLIMEAMRVNPKAKTKDLKALVQNNLNLPVTDTLLRAAMSKATKQIAGELLDTSTQPSLLLHGHPSHRCCLRLLSSQAPLQRRWSCCLC